MVHTCRGGEDDPIVGIISARKATKHERTRYEKKHTDDPVAEAPQLATDMNDEDVDTGDIPEITDAQWATARKGRYFRPTKTSVTIRLDSDLVYWFKARAETGGYQTEINRVLRRHMLEAIKKDG